MKGNRKVKHSMTKKFNLFFCTLVKKYSLKEDDKRLGKQKSCVPKKELTCRFWIQIVGDQLLSCLTLQPYELQHTRLPCPSPSPWVFSSSCPLSQCCHLTSHPLSLSSLVLSFPRIKVSFNESVLTSGGQSIGPSASTSVLPMNIQDWPPLGWTGWISLLVKGLKRILQHHSLKASIFWCSAFFMVQLSRLYMTTGKALTIQIFVGNVMSLLFKTLSRFVIAFLPRSKCF